MDAAIADLRASPSMNIATAARKHKVSRGALSRRSHGKATTMKQCVEARRALTPQQETKLIDYIRIQSELCLPPTPAMVAKIASEMAGSTVSASWSSRFVARNKAILDSQYLNTLDLARHKADTRDSYERYFAVLGEKLEEYAITADNIYNMDEKGFMIGQCQKTRRIFTRQTFEQNKLARAGQDGSREWVTTLAAICADGTALSPSLIYKASSGEIQDDWLQDFHPQEHSCNFASTQNGWTSDEHGLAWLEQVFEKETRSKARRSWRLLFIDGHGSPLNMKFIERCYELKILLAIYPPHSTHRLQPLDVSCFNPLANYYSQGLAELIAKSAGHISIKKRDFFPIFWNAYGKAFNEKNISSAWLKTGIWPFNPQIVLDNLPARRMRTPPSMNSMDPICSSPLAEPITPTRSRKLRKQVFRASAKTDLRASKVIIGLYDQLAKKSADLTITKLDNERLKESLTRERRRKTRRKKVLEQLRSDGQTGALFMSPSKVQKARDILAVREQEEQQLQRDRESRKEAVAQKKADRELELEQRREARAVAAAARQAAAAEKKATSEAARATRKAQKELETAAKAAIKVSRAQPKPKIIAPRPKPKPVRRATPETIIQVKSRSGRIMRPSVRLRT